MPAVYQFLEEVKLHTKLVRENEPEPTDNIARMRWRNKQAVIERQGTASTLKPSDILSVPGGVILHRMVGEKNLPNLFTSFCAYFHIAGNWTWDPGRNSADSWEVLDGVKKKGQCRYLAAALNALAQIGTPYGLGLKSTVVPDVITYDGLYGEGFVSEHPVDGILGLRPNIFKPSRFRPRSPYLGMANLYLWGDHKVQPYGGRLYDACYRKIYEKKANMAKYHINQQRQVQQGVVIPRGVVVAEDRSGSPVYFLEFNTKTCGFLARATAYMGPYAKVSDISKEVMALAAV
jgi:hypothetical protein